MANKQKQMLAVWGSPGGGKTVTAVKLALELSKRKKNVVLVFTDVTAPTLPAVVSEKKLPDVSVGGRTAGGSRNDAGTGSQDLCSL